MARFGGCAAYAGVLGKIVRQDSGAGKLTPRRRPSHTSPLHPRCRAKSRKATSPKTHQARVPSAAGGAGQAGADAPREVGRLVGGLGGGVDEGTPLELLEGQALVHATRLVDVGRRVAA